MPRIQPRTIPLDIVQDHFIARLRRASALIDTGSPFTMATPEIVEEQLGESIRWLVGTDVLRSDRFTLDWPGRQLLVGGPALPGETLPLTSAAGVYQIELESPIGTAQAFLDTGAPVSYGPAAAVAGLTPVDRRTDFYPMFGEFELDVYRLRVRVGSREFEGSFGVLPELLAGLLTMVGGSGWILGADFFRERQIQLDLSNCQLVDATRAAA